MNLELGHQQEPNQGFFYLESEKHDKLGQLTYILFASGRLVIQHTEVDHSLSGSGAAVRLIDAAADFARAQGYRIVPVCPFAKRYMNLRRERYEDVLV